MDYNQVQDMAKRTIKFIKDNIHAGMTLHDVMMQFRLQYLVQ